jgi:hypothetical protein
VIAAPPGLLTPFEEMGTLNGTVVCEGGPHPSIAFLHDDPTLCSAAEWWTAVARAAARVLVPFAVLGAVAGLAAGAPVWRLAAWIAAGTVAGAGVRLAAHALTRRAIVLRDAAGAAVGPVPRMSPARVAAAVLARAWMIWPVVALVGASPTPRQALVAAAWSPSVVAAWAAAGAAVMAAAMRRGERTHGVRLLLPAGLRQRVAAGPVLHTLPAE